MTGSQLENLLGRVLREFRKRQIDPLMQRLELLEKNIAIEQRLAALERNAEIEDIDARFARGKGFHDLDNHRRRDDAN